MCDFENVRFTWQLVSQFISWDFCRYTSEQSENPTPETDVLTFLRNMIVDRTEKSISEITKHEIIAKFIMETKGIQTAAQLSSITTLSEGVKKVCPELSLAVCKLLHELESLINALDWKESTRANEIIHLRMEDVINDFSKEATKLLPIPDLLKVVQAWIHHDHKQQPLAKKKTYNSVLFERVVECLHYEGITPAEAKVIAVALYDDKTLESFLLNAESETETELGSDPFSLSIQSSQPLLSQELSQPVETNKLKEHLRQVDPTEPSVTHTRVDSSVVREILQKDLSSRRDSPQCHLKDFNLTPKKQLLKSLGLSPRKGSSVCFSENVDFNPENPPSPEQFCQEEEEILDQSLLERSPPPPVTCSTSPSKPKSNNYFYGLSSDSDDMELSLNSRFLKNKRTFVQPLSIESSNDSDTSDCDKDPEFRFLTPTLFKENNKNKAQTKVLWLSDSESNGSSVISNIMDSQQNDPIWKDRSRAPRSKSSKPKPTKKRRLSNKSADRSINDFITPVGRKSPVRDAPAKEPSIPKNQPSKGPRPPRARKKKNPVLSREKHKCPQCSNSYKALISLRRHVFLKHPSHVYSDSSD